ncbi:MAG: hypothetical protein ABS46_01980 [Cytophagaceae bacterium SCN 52-12]|nr:MAG: hypothetical protein ABS46_01980 [Cytophagaceae bacterium SCN 52-12]
MMTSLKKQTLSDELAERLREKIMAGQYNPGDKLPTEPELMALFEVSRSTVREAMRVLANSGWVRVQQGSGTFVETNQASSEPLYQRLKRGHEGDLEEVRELLEQKIIEKATQFRTREDIRKMRECLEERRKYAALGDTNACINADLDFHTLLACASANPVLADLYQALAIRLKESFVRRFQTVESFQETQLLHEELLECIRRRDAGKAIQILNTIVRS